MRITILFAIIVLNNNLRSKFKNVRHLPWGRWLALRLCLGLFTSLLLLLSLFSCISTSIFRLVSLSRYFPLCVLSSFVLVSFSYCLSTSVFVSLFVLYHALAFVLHQFLCFTVFVAFSFSFFVHNYIFSWVFLLLSFMPVVCSIILTICHSQSVYQSIPLSLSYYISLQRLMLGD